MLPSDTAYSRDFHYHSANTLCFQWNSVIRPQMQIIVLTTDIICCRRCLPTSKTIYPTCFLSSTRSLYFSPAGSPRDYNTCITILRAKLFSNCCHTATSELRPTMEFSDYSRSSVGIGSSFPNGLKHGSLRTSYLLVPLE